MKMRQGKDQKVEEILNSLDGIQRAAPAPFFYTRLIGRLQRNDRSSWEKMGSFIARPAVVVCGLCMILVMNIYMLVSQDASANTSPASSVADQSEPTQTDNEYLLATNSSFYYENIDQ